MDQHAHPAHSHLLFGRDADGRGDAPLRQVAARRGWELAESDAAFLRRQALRETVLDSVCGPAILPAISGLAGLPDLHRDNHDRLRTRVLALHPRAAEALD